MADTGLPIHSHFDSRGHEVAMDNEASWRQGGQMSASAAPRLVPAVRLARLVEPELAQTQPGPAYSRLAEALRRAIADGRVPHGTRLPSERDLTGPVGLSRTTVTRAYALLREQGYLATRRGSGSVVQVPDVPGGRVDHLLAPTGLDDAGLDLTCTAPSAPPGTTAAYDEALSELGPYLPGTGYYPSGLPVLRERIARRFTARGLATDPDQVIITAGALAGTAVAVRALVRRRDPVLVESPTYPNVIATLEGAGSRVVPHPLDHLTDDWDIPGLVSAVRSSGARVAYLIPDFHNPTAALMSDEQRPQVGRLLRTAGIVPIIDESLVDLPLEGQAMPEPLTRHVPDSVVVGSTSKWLWGGLRIGWIRAPRSRVEELASARLQLDLGAPVLEQLVVGHLLDRSEEILAARRAGLLCGPGRAPGRARHAPARLAGAGAPRRHGPVVRPPPSRVDRPGHRGPPLRRGPGGRSQLRARWRPRRLDPAALRPAGRPSASGARAVGGGLGRRRVRPGRSARVEQRTPAQDHRLIRSGSLASRTWPAR